MVGRAGIAALSIVATAATAALLACQPLRADDGGLARFGRTTLSIETQSGKRDFEVEVARTPRQQAQGLMFRRNLAPDAGMLFVHDEPHVATMWMKNTFIPLDMIFIDGGGRIVRIAERTVPLSEATISSGAPVIAVLEVNGGTASRLGIRPGDRVVSPALAPP